MTTIDYLVLGHVAHDRTPQGPQLGGTVSYAAMVARAMGLRVGILTSAHPDDPVLARLEDVECHLVPAEQSTIFVNNYTPQGRQQIIEGQARVLSWDDVPEDWRTASIVHLGPVSRGLDDTLTPDRFPHSLVGVTPQGWMRSWDSAGLIRPVPWAAAETMLPAASVTVLSDEDLGMSAALEETYAALAPRLVVTRESYGATLYQHGQRQEFSTITIDKVRHPTGAGDVFAAALLAYLHREPDSWEHAMQVAVTVASVFVSCCEAPGVPTLAQMQAVVNDPRVQAVMAS